MKLSSIVALFTLAITTNGYVNAVETNNYLRAFKNVQFLEGGYSSTDTYGPTPQEDLTECLSDCSEVLDKPSKKQTNKLSRKDIKRDLQSCSDDCYEVASEYDPVKRAALENEIPQACPDTCANKAAKKFKTVSKDCDKLKKCKKCKKCEDFYTDTRDLDRCEKDLNKCMKTYDSCKSDHKSCDKEQKDAQKSVQRVEKEYTKCLESKCFPASDVNIA